MDKHHLETSEEKQWESYEEGWGEGYEDGANDFEEVENRKQILRKKGLLVR